MNQDKKKRSLLSGRGFSSIRTRYAVVTAFFLFLFLGVFYVGGRWMLSNLVYDTASQVRDAGRCVAVRIQRQTDGVRSSVSAAMAAPGADRASPREFLAADGTAFSFVARFSVAGDFVDGAIVAPRHRGAALAPAPAALSADDFAGYAPIVRDWARMMGEAKASSGSASADAPFETGILRLHGRLHYAAFVWRGEDLMLFGMPFSVETFARGESGHAAELRVRSAASGGETVRAIAAREPGGGEPSPKRSPLGISPMFTESEATGRGGHPQFWGFRSDPLETVFVLRDISGRAISELAVSLPKAFSSAAKMAVWQLAFFIAFGGILFVLPIFWAQNRLLLNPLTRMTRMISELGARDAGVECPRITWEGKDDEFAVLAESVNRMLEAIAAKTVSLANVESRHKALIAGVPDALVVFDPQGRLVSVTKEAEGSDPVPGLVPGSVPSASVYGEEGVASFVAALKATFAGRPARRLRAVAKASDGSPERHFEVRFARMGELFVLAIVRDVTRDVEEHERRLAAEARASDASKRESLTNMAAGVAHDMNNVLTVILNTVANAEATPDDDKGRTIAAIRDAMRRGSSLMRELSAFAGENQMKFERASPRMVLEDIRSLAMRVVGPGVELSLDAADDAPDVDVDLGQFWKVFVNLIKNAGEAIGDRHGRITIRVRPMRMTAAEASQYVSERPLPDGDGAVFGVADDGPGISPEVALRIFDPYVSSKGFGRGLGLATVRTIVEAHGGGIRVVSEPGCGTTFLIYLPASKTPRGAARPAVAPRTDAESLSGTILVVDDDMAILKTTRILCKAIGLEAHLALDRREALAVVRRRSEHIRAILLDAHLGAFDTVRLLAAFRLGAPGVPVIVASGSSEEKIRDMFRLHPYDAFLSKPYTVDELRAAVKKAFAAAS